jgi:catechol 2,3-dioxygenase-like lactoylglutathione lyase family enzyme
MFGRFLEISIATDDITASVQFYERLGFTQLTTGDAWSHPYGVLGDGRIVIGLHQRRAPSPALAFVRPGLERHADSLRAAGLDAVEARLAEGDFHELRLRDPAGQYVTLLEARTYSPPAAPLPPSLCGWFQAYSMPARDVQAVQAFWERAGFVALEAGDEPLVQAVLTSDTLNLGLHSPRTLADPVLMFACADAPARIAQLLGLGVVRSPDLPRGLDPGGSMLIEAPEGTLLLLAQEPS